MPTLSPFPNPSNEIAPAGKAFALNTAALDSAPCGWHRLSRPTLSCTPWPVLVSAR